MKSTITRERLEKIKSWSETYGAGNNVMLPAEEAEELARIALAAMDSEPVAWRVSFTQMGHESNNFTKTYWDEEEKDRWVKLHKMSGYKVVVEPLYRHAQPAPVVPEEATPDSIEILASARRRDRAVFQWDEDQRNAAADSWNACRAAMLAAAQPAPTIQVTDAMAYAFHHALTDGPLGDDDVEDIKTGLRSAFANVSTNQSVLVVPDRFIFEKWWETQNGSPLDGWDSLRTTDGYCDEVIDGQFEAWRACRAAMCATDKSSNHADCQSKLIKNCASGASAKQHG